MSKIACFGDSLIQGFPFTEENSWVACVETIIGMPMLNHGCCGECCDDIADRLTRRFPDSQITHILFEGGMNDIIQGCPLSFSLEQIKKAQHFSTMANRPFCLVLPWYCAASELNPLIQRLREAMLKNFSDSCFLLDFEPMFGPLSPRNRYFIWDGVHPTAATYEELGRYAAPILQQWIESTSEEDAKKKNI